MRVVVACRRLRFSAPPSPRTDARLSRFARGSSSALALVLAVVSGACRDERPRTARPPLDPRPAPVSGAATTPPPGAAPDEAAGGELPAAADLLWHSQDFDVFLAADFARLRALPLWSQHLEPWILSTAPATWAALRAGCPFDPLRQARAASASIVFLRNNLGATLIVHGIDADALFACLRAATPALGADGIAVRWEEKQAAVSLVSRDSSLAIFGNQQTLRLTFNDVIRPGATTLRSSPGFHERMRAWDRRAALWFAVPGDSPILTGKRAAAGTRDVVVTSISGSFGAVPAEGADDDVLLAQARLTALTPERARAYGNAASARRAAAAPFTRRFDVAIEDRDVHLTAELTAEQLLTLAISASLPVPLTMLPDERPDAPTR